MRKPTIKQAKNLSIKKWELIVEQGGSERGIEEHPLFRDLVNNCGLCQRYIPTKTDNCGDCPLSRDRDVCCDEFFRWNNAPSQENAQAVLDKIKAIET